MLSLLGRLGLTGLLSAQQAGRQAAGVGLLL
jgi:hypothetical protein